MNARNVAMGTEPEGPYRRRIAISENPDFWLDDRLITERWGLCQRIYELKYAPSAAERILKAMMS